MRLSHVESDNNSPLSDEGKLSFLIRTGSSSQLKSILTLECLHPFLPTFSLSLDVKSAGCAAQAVLSAPTSYTRLSISDREKSRHFNHFSDGYFIIILV